MNEAQLPVVLSCYGSGGASTRVRLYDWLRHTQVEAEIYDYVGGSNNHATQLIRVPVKVLRAERELRGLRRRLGERTLIVSRQASPFSSGGLAEQLLDSARHSVYDFDDALFADDESLTGRIWSKPAAWRRSVQAADVVIAGSDLLADAALKFTPNVVMVPSCVEPADYTVKVDYELSSPPRGVWLGSPPTEPFLRTLTEPLLHLHKRFGLRLSVVSAGNASLGSLDSMVDRTAWSPMSFAQVLAAADFGVMPLPDTPFTRGKCSYKLLQYAASGLPLIGSPVGANAKALDVLRGYAASTSGGWIDVIESILLAPSSERARSGEVARKAVIDHYSYSTWEKTWLRTTGISSSATLGPNDRRM